MERNILKNCFPLPKKSNILDLNTKFPTKFNDIAKLCTSAMEKGCSWQLKTEFCYKLSTLECHLPDVSGGLMRFGYKTLFK